MIGQTPKLDVQLRGGFSDRNKIKVENCTLQTDSFDARTRTALINQTRRILDSLYSKSQELYQEFLITTLSEVYMQEIRRDANYDSDWVEENILYTIRVDDYDSVLTLVEFIAQKMIDFTLELLSSGEFSHAAQMYNSVFEKEYVGYRFVGEYILPITNELERAAIEDALDSDFQKVQQHFKKAATLLADRISPDYANSIKESISAVERMCSIILGKSFPLGDALKKLEKRGIITNSRLRESFEKLYA